MEEGNVDDLIGKEDYTSTHWIPRDETQYEYPQFEHFLNGESGRKQLIKEQLKQTLPSQSHGCPIEKTEGKCVQVYDIGWMILTGFVE